VGSAAADRARGAPDAPIGQDAVEEAYWTEVKRGGTPRHYQAYLKEYPNGKHAAQAREAMKSPDRAGLTRAMREEDAAWAKAQLVGTAEAYAAYRQSYPLGRYIPLARLRTMDLERARPQSIRDCPECPEMVIVPAGSFDMGSPDDEAGREAIESPRHRVALASFAAGKYEVTFDEWDTCVRAGGCREIADDGGWGRGRRPVRKVTWNDAREYVAWLALRTGKRYRCPVPGRPEPRSGFRELRRLRRRDGCARTAARRQLPAERVRIARHGR
jgi:Sulfatase-modifying factor enzyme 1